MATPDVHYVGGWYSIDEGQEIVINDASRLEASSEDQWMRAVDTESSEFLRIKFAIEAERAAQP